MRSSLHACDRTITVLLMSIDGFRVLRNGQRVLTMGLDDVFGRFGFSPSNEDIPEIRRILDFETENGLDADTEVMRLCCVYLFSNRSRDDVLRIWRAKRPSMDADGAVDVDLMLGPGLTETKAFLKTVDELEAPHALQWIEECEDAGDLSGFEFEDRLAFERRYYSVNNDD